MGDNRWTPLFAAYVSKLKRGSNGWWNGFCPLHENPDTSKTPSFGFNGRSGGWRCQGCGESGNAYQFLARMENRPFDRDRAEDVQWARSVLRERFPAIGLGHSYGRGRRHSGGTLSAAEIEAAAALAQLRKEMQGE